MKMPNEINICGVPFKIEKYEDRFVSDSAHFGEIDHKAGVIRVAADMPETMQVHTVIHEWLHGALYLLGFGEECANETLVQGLATAIYQTFRLKESEGE